MYLSFSLLSLPIKQQMRKFTHHVNPITGVLMRECVAIKLAAAIKHNTLSCPIIFKLPAHMRETVRIRAVRSASRSGSCRLGN